MTNIDSILKSRDITLLTKFHIVKAMVFLVVMHGCENQTIEEGWQPKNWRFQTVMLEKTIESPLDSKIKPVNPKGNQPWLFIGRTVAEAEALILRLCDVKNWFIGKDAELGKTEGKKRRRWQRMRWLDSINESMDTFEQTLGDSEGKPGMLQSLGSQRIWHNWATEQQQPLRYIRQMTNKDVLYSTGNSTQYSGVTYMRKEPKKEWIYI